MAYTIINGFETGSVYSDVGQVDIWTGAAVSVVTTPIRTGTGTYALKTSATSGTDAWSFVTLRSKNAGGTFRTTEVLCARCYFYIETMPNFSGSFRTIFNTFDGSSGTSVLLRPDTGTLQIATAAGTSRVDSAAGVVTTGQWYKLSFDASGGTRTLYLDDVQIAQSTGGVSAAASERIEVGYDCWKTGASGATVTFSFLWDDVITSNSSFGGPGPSSGCKLLLPAADPGALNSWTNGGGGTTSIFEGVNNRPPTGAAAATNGIKIKNAGSTANLDYVATMQTYTAGGIPAGATINAVMPICVDGEEVTTGTKTGNIWCASNPSQTAGGNSFDYGDDLGALGTFPTLWMPHYGPATSSPSVTLGTAPTVTVRKTAATARVVDVTLLGLYVDYTPAAPAGTTQMGMII